MIVTVEVEENNFNNNNINNHFFGKYISNIKGLCEDSDNIFIEFENGESITMYHDRKCCESVTVDDIVGELDLVGARFFEIIEKKPTKQSVKDKSCTWTFYTIRTSKGYTDIKWYGESNGHYSEEVSFKTDIHSLLYIDSVSISVNDTVHDIYKKIYSVAMEDCYESRPVNILLCKHKISYDLYCKMQALREFYNETTFTIIAAENYINIFEI